MKKLLIFCSVSLLLICLSFQPMNAQDKKAMQFGVKGGLNLSNLYTSDAKSSDMITGF